MLEMNEESENKDSIDNEVKTDLPLITCQKCGVKAVMFICDTPGCPVNGGAYYE